MGLLLLLLLLLLQVRNIGPNTILLSPDTRSERTIHQVRMQACGVGWFTRWRLAQPSRAEHVLSVCAVQYCVVDVCAPVSTACRCCPLRVPGAQVLPPAAWDVLLREVERRLAARPGAVQHLIVLLPVPIVYPKIPVTETVLGAISSKHYARVRPHAHLRAASCSTPTQCPRPSVALLHLEQRAILPSWQLFLSCSCLDQGVDRHCTVPPCSTAVPTCGVVQMLWQAARACVTG